MKIGRISVNTLLACVIILSVCLVSCSNSSSTIIPETTKVLDEPTLNALSETSVNSSTLIFGNVTEQLNSLSLGDVIVCGVSNATPYGLLRKVTDIIADEGQMMVETENATLEDAIEQCDIDTTWRLQPDGTFAPLEAQMIVPANTLTDGNPAPSVDALATGLYWHVDDAVLYDQDGNPSTKDDQITADIFTDISIDLDFDFTIRGFNAIDLCFQPTVSTVVETELLFKTTIAEISVSRPLYRRYLRPFTVWAGFVPVVILPVIEINAGLNGEVSAGVGARVTADDTFTVGIRGKNGDWSTTASHSTSFDWDTPIITGGCNVKPYVGPRLSLLLYGGAGPYLEGRAYLELDVDLFRTPWWELYGGLEADVGFRVEAFSHKIANYEHPLAIGLRKLLAQAETETPVNLTISSAEGGSVVTPGEGTFVYDEGAVANLVAEAEGGYQFVNWTGDEGTVDNVDTASTTITMDDDYSITANFEELPVGEYMLTISSTDGGSVTSPGEGTYAYDAGTVVDLVAEADETYCEDCYFAYWSGIAETGRRILDPTTTVTMNDNYTITANFESDNIALGKPTAASSSRPNLPPERAVDGDLLTGWGSTDWPPGWIEVDLQDPYNIGRIRLCTDQESTPTETVHQVLGKGPGTGGEFQILHGFHGVTEDYQLLEYTPATPWEGIQFIRIETLTSPSWVGWREIEIWQP